MECIFPSISPSVLDSTIDYTVSVDGAEGPMPSSDIMLQLTIRANPIINGVITREITLPTSSDQVIRIEVSVVKQSIVCI